jgi:hypothetical protein
MGLLSDLGYDDLANDHRISGASLSDVIQAAGPPVTQRAKEHARQYIKPYSSHTLFIPQHQPLLSACKVSATPDGQLKAFTATGSDVLEFRKAIEALDRMMGGGSTALDSRGGKQASKTGGLEFISKKFESDHCSANKICSVADASNRIYGANPVPLSSWIPIDDVKKLNKEMKDYNATNVYAIIEEYLRLVVAWSVETRNPEDMLFTTTVQVQTWTYKKHAQPKQQADRKVQEQVALKGYLHYAIVPDAADAEGARMLLYHYDNAFDNRTTVPTKGGTFKQILQADAERKSRMTYNGGMLAWPLVYYKT